VEYKKNRLCFVLLNVCFLLCAIQIYAKPEDISLIYSAVPVAKDLQWQAKISKYRLIVIPGIVAFTLCCNQKKIFQMIESSPVSFALLAYLLGNFVIDSVTKYQQIDYALNFFLFAQKISHYTLCLFAIKNTMKKMTLHNSESFNEQRFLSLIYENSGYSLEELEVYSIDLLNSSLYVVDKLCIDTNPISFEEKVYILRKEQISLEQILLLCTSDLVIHELLVKFHKNPESEFELVMKKICFLIRKHFNSFMKNNR
jgi:hypothetical protein